MFARFLMVGGLATAIHYCLLVLLVQLGGADPVWASAAGFFVSAVFNYLLNRSFTFRSPRPHAAAFPRFAVVALTGLTLNSLVMFVLVHQLGLVYLLAQVITTVFVLVWNYLLNKHWSFAAESTVEHT